MASNFKSTLLTIIPGCFFCLSFLQLRTFGNAENKIAKSASVVKINAGPFAPNQDTMLFRQFDDILSYFTHKMDSIEKIWIAARKMHEAGGEIKIDSVDRLEAAYRSILHERDKTVYHHIVTHKKDEKNLRSLFFITMTRNVPVYLIDSLLHAFPLSLQTSSGGQKIKKEIKTRIVQANQFTYNPEILSAKFITTEGEKFSLNEISTKYILLDFWSSWCGPCRLENRIMTKNKDAIVKQGNLTIVAVSLDIKSEKWLKASKDDNLNYLSVCDLKELDSPIAKEFNIEKIPYNVIITKDGKIVKRDIWGDELVQFVNTLP